MSIYKKMLTIVFMVLILVNCGKKEEEKIEELRPVRHEKIFLDTPTTALSFTGDIISAVAPEVSFRVSGNIEKMNFKLGESVKEGDILAILDKTDYEIKLRQAESSYETAKASQIEAESNYNRIKELYQNDSVSKSEFESAKAKMDSSTANLKVANEGVKYAKRQLEYTTLKSSIKGVIAVKTAEVNENIAAGQSIYLLSANDDLEAVSFVPESAIGKIKLGSKVNIRVEALEKNYTGEVVEVAMSSVQYGATYPVKVSILNSETELKSGMAVIIDFNKEETEDKRDIFIPLKAVLKDETSNYVYIVEKSSEDKGTGIIKRVDVKIGNVTNKGLEILEGLKPGQNLVTAGMTKLKDGQKVQFK